MSTYEMLQPSRECLSEEAEEPPPNPGRLPAKSSSRSLFELISPQTREFIHRFYPNLCDSQWNDWRWQVRNRIRSQSELCRFMSLSADEALALSQGQQGFPFAVPPYYLSLLADSAPGHPLRLSVLPSTQEYLLAEDEADDPLAEEASSPTPGLVHRYPNRVLFLATDFCSVCCRYCTRSRLIGSEHRESPRKHWQAALKYIAEHKEIEDVLISGGDPLTLPQQTLEALLAQLKQIRHLKIIRIGSKVPAVLPQRISSNLVSMLKKYHPLFISLHFTHPLELTAECAEACRRLADAGIPLGSQSVLLKGVNDELGTLRELFMGLLSLRVRPYYLYQCDPIRGSKHFRCPVQRGLELMQGLRGHISGYAIPHYVIDAPGGGGKIPLLPPYCAGHKGDRLQLYNYLGKLYEYPDAETQP
ncbi:MAG: KamA family radical SAM protein [Lentisphaerae bacterium]|nr:KamA family radical SAM protein [Lentisphaerota bacterium]